MLADIASGNLDTADLLFALAAILAILAALFYAIAEVRIIRFAPALLSLAVASLSFAWLAL